METQVTNTTTESDLLEVSAKKALEPIVDEAICRSARLKGQRIIDFYRNLPDRDKFLIDSFGAMRRIWSNGRGKDVRHFDDTLCETIEEWDRDKLPDEPGIKMILETMDILSMAFGE